MVGAPPLPDEELPPPHPIIVLTAAMQRIARQPRQRRRGTIPKKKTAAKASPLNFSQLFSKSAEPLDAVVLTVSVALDEPTGETCT
jgi:hypothetical protein